MTIEADDSSPERLTIGWRSSRYGIVYTLTGFIEDDGCLHISMGNNNWDRMEPMPRCWSDIPMMGFLPPGRLSVACPITVTPSLFLFLPPLI